MFHYAAIPTSERRRRSVLLKFESSELRVLLTRYRPGQYLRPKPPGSGLFLYAYKHCDNLLPSSGDKSTHMNKPLRVCLPSKEREDYISFIRRQGVSEVTERQRNRYVDEFLRYCDDNFGYTDPEKITKAQLQKYAKHVRRNNSRLATSRIKVGAVLQWLRWLVSTRRLNEDPTIGFTIAGLLS